MRPFRFRAGFTIPELLVAILLLGITIAIFTFALNVQRATTRDAKRLSDVEVIRATFSQYWLQKAAYPMSNGVSLGMAGSKAERLNANGLTSADDVSAPVLLDRFPVGPGTNEYYVYRSGDQGYSLKFQTERATAYGPAGIYYAHAQGVDTADEVR